MAVRQYIGARYVPKFMGEWSNTTVYEALSVVDNGLGTTYIATKTVPAGTALTDSDYWTIYGASSGAILDLQTRMGNAEHNIDILEESVAALDSKIDSLKDTVNIEYFRNKKILVAGSSSCNEEVNPPNWVAKMRTMLSEVNATVTNISFGGSSLADYNISNSGMVSRIQAETGDYDIILIGVGGNDCTGQGDLGAYYDSDKTTFCGALNVLRSTIVQKWIGAEIFYLIPQKNVLSEDTYPRPIMLNVYRSAIVSACNKFNWHMIDTMCGLPQLDPSNPTIKSTYMPDGIHPSTAYAQIYCNYVLKKLISGGDSRIGKNIELKHYSINSDDGITGDVYLRVDPEANIEVCVHLNIPANVTAGNKVIISDFPTAYFDNYSMETYGNVNGVWTPLQMFVTIAAATGLPSLFVGVPPHSAVINTYSSKMKTLPNVKWMTDGSY